MAWWDAFKPDNEANDAWVDDASNFIENGGFDSNNNLVADKRYAPGGLLADDGIDWASPDLTYDNSQDFSWSPANGGSMALNTGNSPTNVGNPMGYGMPAAPVTTGGGRGGRGNVGANE